MADVKKTVEVNISVTGANTDSLKKLSDSFNTIADSVKKATEAITGLKGVLDGLKSPPALDQFVETVKKFDKIKVPNVLQIAQGFEKLANIKTPPDLTSFANEVKKLANVKVPNILQLGQGLEKLTASTLDMQNAGARLRILYRNLKNFSSVSVPNIVQIGEGLQKLNELAQINVSTKSLESLVKFIKQLDGVKVPNLQKMIDGVKALGDSTLKLGTSYKNLENIYNALQKFTSVKVPDMRGFATGFEKLVKLDIKAVTDKILGLNNALKTLETAGKLQNFTTFARDLATISGGLKQANQALNQYNQTVSTASAQTKTFGDRIRNYFQYRMIADAIYSIKNAIVGSWQAIKEYDQALKDLQAITGANVTEIAQMGDKIKEVAASTKFSASEVAEGMRTIGQAGFTATEAIGTMQAVSDLATGTLSDMATSVDLVTTAMRVFNIDAINSGKVADIFANAVNRSKLTIDKLRTAMNYVGPIAKDAGISLEETSAAMMTLANSGQRASTIGTGLRTIFAELVDPSDKLAAAAAKAGVSLSELDPKTNGLNEVISNLGLVVSDTATAFDLFGKRGASAALALTDSNSQFQDLLSTVDKSGTAAEMAGIQVEGLGVSFKNLMDRLGLLAIAFGEAGITDALKVIINAARGVIEIFTEIVDSAFGKFIIQTGLIVASIGAVISVLNSLAVVQSVGTFFNIAAGATAAAGAAATATTEITLLSRALTLFGGPVGLIITALGALAYTVIQFSDDFEEASISAAKLSAEYSTLEKSLMNYRKTIVGLVDGSDELKKANLDLRDQLLDTASSTSGAAEAALKAANDIDPLTGKIREGSTALEEYKIALDNLNLSALLNAANAAAENVASQTGYISETVSRMKDTLALTGKLITGGFKEWDEYGDRADAALDFSDALANGEKSFQEFSDYISTLKGFSSFTAQEQKLIDSFNLLNERTQAYFDTLLQLNQFDSSYTREQFEELIKKMNVSDELADGLIVKFEQLQTGKFGGKFTSFIEKWEQDIKKTAVAADTLFKKSADGGKELTATEKERILAAQKVIEIQNSERQVLVDKLNALKQIRDEQLAQTTDAEKRHQININYITSEQKLNQEAEALRKEQSKNQVDVDIKEFERLISERDKQLAELNITYEKGSQVFAKKQLAINQQYVKDLQALFEVKIDPKEIYKSSKESIKELEEQYAEYYAQLDLDVLNHTKTEKAASEERRRLQQEEADKKLAIAQDAQDKIQDLEDPNSNDARNIRVSRINAAIEQKKVEVDTAKEAAQEVLKTRKDLFEKEKQERETTFAASMAKLEAEEQSGAKTHEDVELEKLQATLDRFDAEYDAARKYRDSIDEGQSPDEYKAAQEQLLKVEEDYYKEKEDYLSKYNKLVDTLNDNFKDKQEDRLQAEKDYNHKVEILNQDLAIDLKNIEEDVLKDKKELHHDYVDDIEDLEHDLADKIEDINRQLAKDLKSINKSIVDNKNETNADLLGIEQSTADLEKKVRQRGMTERQKDVDNQKTLYQELEDIKSGIAKAEQANDAETLKQYQSRLGELAKEASELNNKKTALSALQTIEEQMKTARSAEGRVEQIALENKALDKQAEAQEKIKDAESDSAYKRQQIDDEYNHKLTLIDEEAQRKIDKAQEASTKSMEAENYRHNNEMANLDKEIAKIKEKYDEAVKGAARAAGDVLGPTTTTADTKTDNPIKKQTDAAKESIKEIDAAVKEVQNTAETVGTAMGQSFQSAAELASKGYEEFVVAVDEKGNKIITTANTMAQGFSTLGEVISKDPKTAVQELEGEISKLAGMDTETEIKVRTDAGMAEVEKRVGAIQAQIASIGQDGAIRIVGDDELARISAAKEKLDFLFEGLQTDDPKQKLQDMITTLEGMDNASATTVNDMIKHIQDYADTVNGVDIETTIDTANGGWKAQIAIVDEAGNKIEGLSKKIQSNPMDLFPADLTQDIVANLGTVNGALDNIYNKTKENVTLRVETEDAKEKVGETLDDFHNLKKDVENNPVTVPVELDAKAEDVVKESLDQQQKEIDQDPVEVTPEVDIAPVNTAVDDTKDKIKEIEEVKPKVDIQDSDKLVALKVLIDEIKNAIKETFTITAVVVGLGKVYELRDAINELPTQKVITIITRYKTEGSPSGAVTAATGGYIDKFADGGNVFSRLRNRFIAIGSGLRDDVPALLMKGEFVQKVAAVRKYGRRFMEMVNSGSYPLNLARQAVSQFAKGGMVGVKFTPDIDTSGFAQHFASGGMVLSSVVGSLRRKLIQLLGDSFNSDVALNIGNVNLNSNVMQRADNITSGLGKSALSGMIDSYTNASQALASGGEITNEIAEFDKQRRDIKTVYDKKITTAKNSGNAEIAALMSQEAEDLRVIAAALQESLATLKEEYDAAVLERKTTNKETVDGIESDYARDVSDENTDYTRQVEDDDADYADEERSYTRESAEAAAELKDVLAELASQEASEKNSILEDLTSAKSDLEDKLKSLNQYADYLMDVYNNNHSRIYTDQGTFYMKDGYHWRQYDGDPNNPSWEKLKSILDSAFVSNAVGRLGKSGQEEAKVTLANYWNEYASANAALAEYGINSANTLLGDDDNAVLAAIQSKYGINTAGQDPSLSVLQKIAASLSKTTYDKQVAAETTDYNTDKEDRDYDWSSYKDEYATNISRRDADHALVLSDLAAARKLALSDEKESLDEDLASLKEDYETNRASVIEDSDNTVASRKEETVAAIEAVKEKLEEDLASIGESMDDELSTIGIAETVSTGSRNAPDFETDTNSSAYTNLANLIRKLKMKRFNIGGFVQHTVDSIPGKDSIMAALTPGEYVVKEPAVKFFGQGFFDQLNNFRIPRFNMGGVVGTLSKDIVDQAAVSTTKHLLALTINGTQHEPLMGTQSGIESILNDLNLGKLRS